MLVVLDGVSTLQVPGRTFPVTALFLEDALEVTNHKVAPNAEWARRGPGEKKNRFRGGAPGGMSPGAGGLCFDFTQGRCIRGSRCKFSHGEDSGGGGGDDDDDWESHAVGMGTMNAAFGMMKGVVSARGAAAATAASRLGGAPGSKAASGADDEDLEESDLKERYPAYPAGVHRALAALDCTAINYDLIVQVRRLDQRGASAR
jgi:hypothetical protein